MIKFLVINDNGLNRMLIGKAKEHNKLKSEER
nr:MAG TPA: hypothetical protein [Caudoviricetes sp.]